MLVPRTAAPLTVVANLNETNSPTYKEVLHHLVDSDCN